MTSVVFSVRMSDAKAKAVRKAATKAGMNRNAWMVSLVDEALGGFTEPGPRKKPQPKPKATPEQKAERKLVEAIEAKCPHRVLRGEKDGGLVCTNCGRKLA